MDLKIEGKIWKNYKSWENGFLFKGLNLWIWCNLVLPQWCPRWLVSAGRGNSKSPCCTMFKRCYDPSLNHCLLHHSHFPSFSHSRISVYLGSFRCSDGCLLFDRMDVEPPLYWAWSWIHYQFQKLAWRATPLSYNFFLRICVNILRILKENAGFSHLCGFLLKDVFRYSHSSTKLGGF